MEIMGDAPQVEPGDEVVEVRPGFFSEPSTLALIAFPLAILVLMGAQVFRGLNYTFVLGPGAGLQFASDAQFHQDLTYLQLGAFLTAAFSLLPLYLGYRGVRRLIDDDPTWVAGLCRASVVLGGLSFALHLISAVLVATNTGDTSTVYFGVS